MSNDLFFRAGQRHYREGRTIMEAPADMSMEERIPFVAGFAHEERFQRRLATWKLEHEKSMPLHVLRDELDARDPQPAWSKADLIALAGVALALAGCVVAAWLANWR